MKRVFRLVSALGAGASLVWGIARSLRNKRKDSSGPGERPPTPEWPPAPPEPPVSEPAPEPPVAQPAPSEPAPSESEPVEPEPHAPSDEPLVLKGVSIAEPERLLAFVNEADEDVLVGAGIKGKALSVLLANRPYASAQALGSTSGIGRRTLQALDSASEG